MITLIQRPSQPVTPPPMEWHLEINGEMIAKKVGNQWYYKRGSGRGFEYLSPVTSTFTYSILENLLNGGVEKIERNI